MSGPGGAADRSCPAKVNLHLEVGPLRRDGFHEVHTLYQAIALEDGLTAEHDSSGPSLEVTGPRASEAPVGEENLVLRATRAFARARGAAALETRWRLDKSIPAGAGLGGGSSDAAAALLLLRRLHDPGCPDAPLMELAAELGSDVPFFLRGGTARGGGRGEELQALEALPPLGVLLAVPSVRLCTADVYRHLDCLRSSGKPLTPPGAMPTMVEIVESLQKTRRVRLRNDLEAAAIGLHPALEALRFDLERLDPLAVAMSGSGSAWFALFPDEAAATEAASNWRRDDAEALATCFRPEGV